MRFVLYYEKGELMMVIIKFLLNSWCCQISIASRMNNLSVYCSC